jgi:hypothetical protein
MNARRVELTSGVWAGHYEQFGLKYPQKMTMEFADGLVRGSGVDGIGTFTLDGEYRVDGAVVRIGWVKTYDGAHSVLYLGTIQRGTLDGRWHVGGTEGRFELVPERAFAPRGSARGT